jgi:signal transduction histidine kinase
VRTASGTREAELAAFLKALADGRAPAPLAPAPEAGDRDWAALVTEANRVAEGALALRAFAGALGDGRIDYEPPAYAPLLGPLKTLQANLRHLTWQARQVADGNLDQQVDFLGEFSASFNRMIESLRHKERAEAEALRASSLAGIGQLAAGLAHELNSATQYIGDNLLYLQNALESLLVLRADAASLPPATAPAAEHGAWARSVAAQAAESTAAARDDDLAAAFQETLEGVRHIERIIRAMSEFSQGGDESCGRANLNQAVENTLVVSSHAWHQVATIDLDLASGLPEVAAQPAEVSQVVLQLLLNAAQAIGGAEKATQGRITVATGREAEEAVLIVADSGPGVPPEFRSRLFDLFFTTKAGGSGRGLGLCTCHEIVVSRLGGRIEVGEAPDGGALFTVRLPLAI